MLCVCLRLSCFSFLASKKKLLPKNRHSIWVTTSWSYPISTLTPERDINGKETRTKGTFDRREKPRQASAAVVGRRRCCRSRVWGEYSHRCWSFSARFFAPSFRHHAIILSSNHRHTFRGFTANIFAWQKRRKPGLADEGCESGGIFCVAVKKELLAFSSARRARNWKAGWKHKGFISVHLRLIFPSTRMALFLLCAALQPFVLLVRAKNVAYGSSSEMYGKKGNSVKWQSLFHLMPSAWSVFVRRV